METNAKIDKKLIAIDVFIRAHGLYRDAGWINHPDRNFRTSEVMKRDLHHPLIFPKDLAKNTTLFFYCKDGYGMHSALADKIIFNRQVPELQRVSNNSVYADIDHIKRNRQKQICDVIGLMDDDKVYNSAEELGYTKALFSNKGWEGTVDFYSQVGPGGEISVPNYDLGTSDDFLECVLVVVSSYKKEDKKKCEKIQEVTKLIECEKYSLLSIIKYFERTYDNVDKKIHWTACRSFSQDNVIYTPIADARDYTAASENIRHIAKYGEAMQTMTNEHVKGSQSIKSISQTFALKNYR